MSVVYLSIMHLAYSLNKKARIGYVCIHLFWVIYLFLILPIDTSPTERLLYTSELLNAYFLEYHVMVLFLITLIPTLMVITYQSTHEILLITTFSRTKIILTRLISLSTLLFCHVVLLILAAVAMLYFVSPLALPLGLMHVYGGYIFLDGLLLLVYHVMVSEYTNQNVFQFALFAFIWFLRVLLVDPPKGLFESLIHYFFPLVMMDKEKAMTYHVVYGNFHVLVVICIAIILTIRFYVKKDLHS